MPTERREGATSGGPCLLLMFSTKHSIAYIHSTASTAVQLPKENSGLKNISDRMVTRGEKSKREMDEAPEASPRRGPTLSTSTSSFEALDPHDPQLNQLASVMFSSTSDWISG